jgi:hypothetical protein
MNVKTLLIVLISFFIVGCSWNNIKPIEVSTAEVERFRLNLSDPEPVQMKEVKFILITENNSEEVFRVLKDNGKHTVLIGLTDDHYENLSVNLAEIRKYVLLQRKIIEEYRNYYESEEKSGD